MFYMHADYNTSSEDACPSIAMYLVLMQHDSPMCVVGMVPVTVVVVAASLRSLAPAQLVWCGDGHVLRRHHHAAPCCGVEAGENSTPVEHQVTSVTGQ